MNKKIMFALISVAYLTFSTSYTATLQEKKNAWVAEMAASKNPHISAETHPTLYGLVQDLVTRTGAEKPRYISLFDAEYTEVRDGHSYHGVHEINAYVDVLGDLYICRELLAHLSYEETQALITLALVEKKSNKPVIVFGTAAATYVGTLVGLYMLNKAWNLNAGYHYSHMGWRDGEEFLKVLFGLPLIPAACAAKIVANNLQKNTDIATAQIVSAQQLMRGIEGQDRVTETYEKQNVITRIADALKLREIRNFIFYPVRAYTTQERVAYLNTLK